LRCAGAVVGSILRTIGAEPKRKRRRQFAFLENFFRRFASDQEQQAGGPLPVDKPRGRAWAGMRLERSMTSYHVTFFKNLVNSNGHQFKCSQGSIDIRRARSDQRALQAAQLRFQRAKTISNWTLYADVVELDVLETNGSARILVQTAAHAQRWDEAA
jgi:hypothetical protein